MLLSLVTSVVLAQTLPEGAIGGVFVVRETPTEVELAIRFDQEDVTDAPSLPDETAAMLKFRATVKVLAAVSVFDGKGVVASVGTPRFVFRFSCENDGGRRSQAEARVKVLKSKLARPLSPRALADGVAGIAVVGKPRALAALAPLEPGAQAFLSVDLDRDGKPDARLAGWEDEAMNCDVKTGKQLSVQLSTAASSRALRCCGP